MRVMTYATLFTALVAMLTFQPSVTWFIGLMIFYPVAGLILALSQKKVERLRKCISIAESRYESAEGRFLEEFRDRIEIKEGGLTEAQLDSDIR